MGIEIEYQRNLNKIKLRIRIRTKLPMTSHRRLFSFLTFYAYASKTNENTELFAIDIHQLSYFPGAFSKCFVSRECHHPITQIERERGER